MPWVRLEVGTFQSGAMLRAGFWGGIAHVGALTMSKLHDWKVGEERGFLPRREFDAAALRHHLGGMAEVSDALELLDQGIAALEREGLLRRVEGGLQIVNWASYQIDSSRDRTAEWRKRNKVSRVTRGSGGKFKRTAARQAGDVGDRHKPGAPAEVGDGAAPNVSPNAETHGDRDGTVGALGDGGDRHKAPEPHRESTETTPVTVGDVSDGDIHSSSKKTTSSSSKKGGTSESTTPLGRSTVAPAPSDAPAPRERVASLGALSHTEQVKRAEGELRRIAGDEGEEAARRGAAKFQLIGVGNRRDKAWLGEVAALLAKPRRAQSIDAGCEFSPDEAPGESIDQAAEFASDEAAARPKRKAV